MTLAEEGAYRRLLDFCWLNGSIPADKTRCARLIGKGATSEMAEYVLQMFTPDPTNPQQMIHDRLESEREKQEENRQKKVEAAEARWSKRGTPADARGERVKSRSDAPALHLHSSLDAPALQTQCSASSSASASSKNNPPRVREGIPPIEIENPELEALAEAVQTVTGVKAGSWQLDGQIRTAAMELQQQGFSAVEVIETARQSGKAYKLKFIASDLATERAQLGAKRNGNSTKLSPGAAALINILAE